MKLLSRMIAVAVFLNAFAFPVRSINASSSPVPVVFHDEDTLHFEAAQDLLQKVEKQLKQCKLNKGNHCTQALTAVQNALKHVKAGIQASD